MSASSPDPVRYRTAMSATGVDADFTRYPASSKACQSLAAAAWSPTAYCANLCVVMSPLQQVSGSEMDKTRRDHDIHKSPAARRSHENRVPGPVGGRRWDRPCPPAGPESRTIPTPINAFPAEHRRLPDTARSDSRPSELSSLSRGKRMSGDPEVPTHLCRLSGVLPEGLVQEPRYTVRALGTRPRQPGPPRHPRPQRRRRRRLIGGGDSRRWCHE